MSPPLLRSALAVLLSFALVATPALAGSRSSPEIADERGDVDVQHLVDADVLSGEDGVPEELEMAGDILQAWIAGETEDTFEVHIELADLPDEEPSVSPLVEIWTHFTIREGSYHAVATLAQDASDPSVEATYDLYLGDAKTGNLAGEVDVDEDIVSIQIPKADVRDPTGDDELSRFYVTTHAPGSQATLDYAPGTNEESLPGLLESESADPMDLDLSADPRFGDTYRFESFEQTPSQLAVDVTPGSLEIPAGEPGAFAVRITNDADRPEDISLTVPDPPTGWSARLDPSSLTVPAHGSEGVRLEVTPAADAEAHELLELLAMSEEGLQRGASVSVVAVQQQDRQTDESAQQEDGRYGSDETRSGRQDGTGDLDANGSSEEEAGHGDAQQIPAIAAVPLLVTIAASALLTRRRS